MLRCFSFLFFSVLFAVCSTIRALTMRERERCYRTCELSFSSLLFLRFDHQACFLLFILFIIIIRFGALNQWTQLNDFLSAVEIWNYTIFFVFFFVFLFLFDRKRHSIFYLFISDGAGEDYVRWWIGKNHMDVKSLTGRLWKYQNKTKHEYMPRDRNRWHSALATGHVADDDGNT